MNEDKKVKLTKAQRIELKKGREENGQRATAKRKLVELGMIDENKTISLAHARGINYFLNMRQQLNEEKLDADMLFIINSILKHPLESTYTPETWAKTIILVYGSAEMLGKGPQAFLEDIKRYEYSRAAAVTLILLNYVELTKQLNTLNSNIITDILKHSKLYELATYIKILYYQGSLNMEKVTTIHEKLRTFVNYFDLSEKLLEKDLIKLKLIPTSEDKQISDEQSEIKTNILDIGINNPVLLVSELVKNFKEDKKLTIDDIKTFISQNDYLTPTLDKLQDKKQYDSVVSSVSSSSLFKVEPERPDASASVSSCRP